jgi:beta-mannosidase
MPTLGEVYQTTAWQLTHAPLPVAWTAADLGRLSLDWRDAVVPGSIQHSAFGVPVPALYVGDRLEAVRWMEAEHWIYRTQVDVPALPPGREAVYSFAGIDYTSTLLLDGEIVRQHEGMFAPVEISLCPGRHELLVILAPCDPNDPETLKAGYSVGRGWDFAPQLQSRGLWDDAYLLVRDTVRVTGVAVDTALQSPQRADVLVRTEFSTRIANGTLQVTLDGVTRAFPLINTDQVVVPLNIPSPTLWWPNGQGTPALVELRLDLQVAGVVTSPFVARVGLRSLERIPCDGQGGEDLPLQLLVNHRKVFLKGVNWVPLDACPGSITPARYRTFLTQFQAAGVNCIRVWGGGLRERAAFYALADELGLMVMQEFPLACRSVPRSPHFLTLLTQECTAIIRALRAHPCVVIWSGGNELYHYWDAVDSGTPEMAAVVEKIRTQFAFAPDERIWQGGAARYDEPGLALMGELCARLDPGRPFQLTSAMEGEGEVHGIWTWNPRVGDHRFRDFPDCYAYWLAAGQHLYSECSLSAIANLETIRAVCATPTPALPDPADPIWRLHHAFGAAWDHLPDLWLDLPSTEALFGPLADLEELIFANQWMQAEGARFLIEELRRKIGRTCGVIWWGVNEPWPGLAGNALIDYFGRPKLGWHALATAFQPTILTLRYQHCVARRIKPELWLSHDGAAPFTGRYQVTLTDLATGAEDRYAGAVCCEPYRALYLKTLLPLRMPAGTRAHAHCELWSAEECIHTNDYLFASAEDAVPFDAALRARMRALWPPRGVEAM